MSAKKHLWLRFLSLISVFVLATSFAPAAVSSALPPLPKRPKGSDLKIVFFLELQDLRSTLNLMPNAEAPDEVQTYHFLPEFAPDTSANVQLLSRLYIAILKDYQSLIKLESEGHTPFNDVIPDDVKMRLDVANYVRTASFLLHENFDTLITVLHASELADRRLKMSERRNRTLESAWAMGRSSTRGRQTMTRMLSVHDRDIAKLNAEMLVLVNDSLSASGSQPLLRRQTLQKKLESFNKRSFTVVFRMEQLRRKIYQALQLANDLVRSDRLKTVGDLEREVHVLGRDLAQTLAVIDRHEKLDSPERQKLRPRLAAEGAPPTLGLMLTDLESVLDGRTEISVQNLLHSDRSEGEKQIYAGYRDAVTMQSIVATSSLMAAIDQMKEGQSGRIGRIAQELRFRQAQLRLARPSTSLVVSDRESLLESSLSLSRRDFAPATVKAKRNEIEERLWQIFFDAAAVRSPEPPTLLGRTCGDVFRAG